MAQATKSDQLDFFASWSVPEYQHYHRSKQWYLGAAIAAAVLLFFSFFSVRLFPPFFFYEPKYLFIIVIVLVALVIIMTDGREPDYVGFGITDDGIVIGRRFFDYDEIRNFSIIYKPQQGVRRLYFEFHSPLKPRLSIPLTDVNPLKIRDFLLNYLEEDLTRETEPLSEQFSRRFKI